MSLVTASSRARPPRLGGSTPATHLLGNGRYSVWLTEAGMGRSSYLGEALTRWAGDRVENADGWRFWLRDLDLGRTWGLAQPGCARAVLTAAAGAVQWSQRDHGIESRLEVSVADGHDAELRTVSVRNHSDRRRTLDVTGCVELVLHDPAADASHPAFSKLFVQTGFDEPTQALVASRRPRSPEERHACVAHALVGEGVLEWETDRARFLGRGRSRARPAALATRRPLAGTVGNVLDPVFAMRRTLELDTGEERRWTFVLAAAPTPEAALATIRALANRGEIDAEAARAREAALTRLDGLTPELTEQLPELTGALLFGDPRYRAPSVAPDPAGSDTAVRSRLAIAPAAPVVLWHAADPGAGQVWSERLRPALAHWRFHGIDAFVVALGGTPPRAAHEPGLVVAGALEPGELLALAAGAAILGRELGSDRPAPGAHAGESQPASSRAAVAPRRRGPRRERAALGFDNGYGGFSADGREYVVRLDPLRHGGHKRPPLPWVNVIANPRFGTLVSETGAGFTWSGNSREHRLTPWSNDPLLDPHGEALCLEDLDTGAAWSPMPGPLTHPAAYETRHGLGYSTFHLDAESLTHETRVSVDADAPVKLVRLRLRNHSPETRRLALVAYAQLVLGADPHSGRRVVTSHDDASDALLATNPAAGAWRDAVAFSRVVAPAGANLTWTTDRAAFIGMHGELAHARAIGMPEAFADEAGAVHDACFAWRVEFELEPGGSEELTFVLGEGADARETQRLIQEYATPAAVEASVRRAAERWEQVVSRVHIETPAPELDLMVNAWLPYQTLSCRLWGRSAFYQSGGAFGFRDQLQDALSLLMLEPGIAREQILLNARHQFVEGDVLHWWHPPYSNGMRTRFADDLLWLPYLASTYVRHTGDHSVLDEAEGFVRARALAPGEDEAYVVPERAPERATVYEHAALAIDRSLAVGAHGLPLFGCGDWNDGMNRVGREGRGESVWMGWFLVSLLGDWAALAEHRAEVERAGRWRDHLRKLERALEAQAWDGEWYRRGWYDDGAPLGSKASDECRIDALAQAWSVLSGAAPRARAERAMDSLEQQLVSEPERLIRLLTPPFNATPHDPGYIKGYVAGVRENGGQYTHAALWVVRAAAELGRRDRAAKWLRMLSPVTHAADAEQARRYQVEPYVVAADVYGVPPHVGRGGWTWYTGSSGWMYRVALESVLGVTQEGGRTLVVKPCIPDDWPGYRMEWQPPGREGTRVEIVVRNPGSNAARVVAATWDGADVQVRDGAARVELPERAARHRLEITLGGTS